MKRVLALTLVLVMVLASSAMAAVEFSGKFTATAEMDSLKPFVDDYELTSKLELTIGASNSHETEEVTDWDFTAGLNLAGDKLTLGKYKLGLYDEWFTGYAWGNAYELSDKGTYFSMISAGKAAAAGSMRARLIVHVLDYADVTFDFTAPDNVRAFVEGNVAGFDLGLGFARKTWTTDASNTIVAQAGYDVPAGDIDVRLQAAVGVNLTEDLGLGLGLSARSDVTEELNIGASVTHANKHWAGDGTAVVKENTILKADATYTEEVFQVKAEGSYTIKPEGTANSNTVTLTGFYRMSDTLAYADLFKAAEWYKNDALAVKAFVSLTDIKLGEVGVDVASPLVADMVWAKAYGRYGSYKFENETKTETKDGEEVFVEETDKGFKAGADVYVQATSKLVVTPFVAYESIGNVLSLGTGAKYKIGLSDTTLDFTLKRVTADEELDSKNERLIKASVTVPF